MDHQVTNSTNNLAANRPSDSNTLSYKGKQIPKEAYQIAQSMEESFYERLVEEMTKGIETDEPSFAKNYYQSLQNSEYSKILSKTQGGDGIKDLVLRQLLPNTFRNEVAINQDNPYGQLQKEAQNLKTGGTNE